MEKIKKIIAVILITAITFTGVDVSTVKASVLSSGKLNTAGTINWEITSDGVLTISGSGTPKSYSSAADLPWNAYREKIKKIQINTDTTGVKNMSFWFSGCKNLTYINRFPDNVENIKYTFRGCTSLEKVPQIPFTVVNMKATFDGCTALKYLPEYEAYCVSNWSYTYRNCSSLEFAFVPVSYPVTSIKSMFQGCTNLNAIVIFNGCIQLKKEECTDLFTDAATAKGKEINLFGLDYSESGVRNLLDAEYGKVTYRGAIKLGTNSYGVSSDGKTGFAYANDTKYMCISGNGKTAISSLLEKFTGQTDVRYINISSGITELPDNAFKGFYSLKNINLPSGLKGIGNGAFRECAALEHVILPAELEKIGDEAFYGCSAMDSMYIPESIKSIGKDAFKGVSSDFYLECRADSVMVQQYAYENGIVCRYPKAISITYRGNVTEGCKIDENSFESIKLVYSDGTKVDIPFENLVIDEYEIVAGDNVITAHYGDFTTTFNVTGAEKSIVGLTAVYDNESEPCIEGGSIDASSIAVIAEYDNNTKKYLKYGGITGQEGTISDAGYYTIDSYSLVISKDGSENKITIRAGVTGGSPVSKTTTLNIPAVKKSVIGLSASYIGGEIVEGMGLNIDNIVAFVNFNNGTKERVLFSGEYNKYGLDINTNYIIQDEKVDNSDDFPISGEYKYSIDAYEIRKGDNRISVWCSNMSASFSVTGIDKSQTGITATYNGSVIEDAELDMDKLDVYVTYNNGTIEQIADKSVISLAENYVIKQGDNYVDVIYTDMYTSKQYRCSVYVKGVEKTPVKITNVIPVRTDIVEGERYSEIEYNLTVLYDNGKEYDVIMKYNMAGYVKAGINKIKVNYRELEYEAEFNAEEFVPVIVTSVGTEAPDKLEKGMGIMLSVTSNSQAALEGKEINWSSSNTNVVKVSGTGMVTAVNYGEADITATVNGRNAVYHVEVPIPEIVGIDAVYTKRVLEDTELDVNDLRIRLILANDDTIEPEEINGIGFEDGYVIKPGKNSVNVYYIDSETSVKYECTVEVEGIEKTPVKILDIKPVRNNIVAGEPLHTLEFAADILYDNDKTYSEIIKYSGKGFVTEGINKVTVAYKNVEKEAEFNGEKFIPKIVQENKRDVPSEVLMDEKIKLAVTGNSESAIENKPVEWRSSDENVIKVSDNGELELIGGGTADITVYVNGETTKITIRVLVTATDLKIENDDITMSAGTSWNIKYNLVPEKSNEMITWVSQNTDIATVSKDGVIEAKNIGVCKITGTTEMGIIREIKLTVRKEATNVELNYSKAYIIKGKTLKLKYLIPEGMHTGSVSWISGNKNIANVTSAGKVVAKGVGATIITVKTAGGKTAKCKVYVRTKPSKITLNKANVTLKKGKTYKLKYSIPKNSYVSKITWSTGNAKVATISSAGVIKAKKTGTTIIKVKTNNGKIARCKVKVVKNTKS